MTRREKGSALFALVAALAILLMIVPLPAMFDPLRPHWLALLLIYWALEVQDSLSLGLAFLLGLLLDVLTGSLMGLHALGLVIMIYLVQRFRARLRFFPPWQQALAVLALLVNDRIILLWVSMLVGEPVPTWQYWLAPLVGMALWPWLFLLLDWIRLGAREKKS